MICPMTAPHPVGSSQPAPARALRRAQLLLDSLGPLQTPQVRIYLGGQTVSLVGTWLQATAQAWVIWELSHSTTALAIASLLGLGPSLLIGPLAGVWADRLDRRRLLIVVQLVAAATACSLALLAQTRMLQLWQVDVLILVLGVDATLGGPAERALLTDLVGAERAREAVALNQVIFQLSRILGPVLAGIIVVGLGPAVAFWLNGLSFLAVAGSLLVIHPRQVLAPAGSSSARALGEALRFIAATPPVLELFVLGFLLTFLALPVMTVLPAVVDRVLHGGPGTLGVLTAASAAGALAGAVVLLPFVRSLSRPGIIVGAAVIWTGIWFVVFSQSAWLPLSILCMLLIGLAGPSVMALATGVLQVVAPLDMRARIQSLFSTITYGAQPVGVLLLGFSADRIGASTGILACGGLIALGAVLVLLARPDLRRWTV